MPGPTFPQYLSQAQEAALNKIATAMVMPGKGILATDEPKGMYVSTRSSQLWSDMGDGHCVMDTVTPGTTMVPPAMSTFALYVGNRIE